MRFTNPGIKLDSSAVESALKEFEFAEMEYWECMNIMQELLELPQECGVPLARKGDPVDVKGHYQDKSIEIVAAMIAAGYSSEVAYKCRNSAASKANKVPLKNRVLRDKCAEICDFT